MPLLGLGPPGSHDRAAIRRAAAGLARAVSRYRRLAIEAPSADLRPLVEGYLLGGYVFAGHRSAPSTQIDQHIDVIARDQTRTRRSLSEGKRIGEAVLLARNLVNEPGGELTPHDFAERAMSVAAGPGWPARCGNLTGSPPSGCAA